MANPAGGTQTVGGTFNGFLEFIGMKEPPPQVNTQYKHEFQQIWNELPTDLQPLVKKYPGFVLIHIIAGNFFGFSLLFSINPFNWITGALLLVMSASLGSSVYKEGDMLGFVRRAVGSLTNTYKSVQADAQNLNKSKQA